MDNQYSAEIVCVIVCGFLLWKYLSKADHSSTAQQTFPMVESLEPWKNDPWEEVVVPPIPVYEHWSDWAWGFVLHVSEVFGYGILWTLWATFVTLTILSGAEAMVKMWFTVYTSSLLPSIFWMYSSLCTWYWTMGPYTQLGGILLVGTSVVFTIAYVCSPP